MARSNRKPLSRRRAAAVKFLSNISFDGSAVNSQESSSISTSTSIIEEPVSSKIINEICYSKKKENLSSSNIILEDVVTSTFSDLESGRHFSLRERSNTGNNETLKYNRKKATASDELLQHLSCSSTESLASGSSSKHRSDFDPRFNKFKEVKIANVNNLRTFKYDRIMLLSPITRSPFYVFSFIPYKKSKSAKSDGKKESGRRRNLSGSRPLSSFMDNLDPFLLLGLEKFRDDQMISYQQLLIPSKETTPEPADSRAINQQTEDKDYNITRCMSVDLGTTSRLNSLISSQSTYSDFRASDWSEFGFSAPKQPSYSPFMLDDPELMSGKHRTVLTFPSYRTSIIDYVRPSELKKEVNEQFREKFPEIQLTLSKLRSIKRDMKKVTKVDGSVDALTVAQAYVYFEKLILRKVINKANRKLCAAVCLVLAAKLNDVKGAALKSLFERVESVFRISHKDLLSLEFAVVVALEFSLHLPTWEVLPHFQRLMYES